MLKFNSKLLKFNGKVLGGVTQPPLPFDEVVIGNQVWASKNLAIDDGGEGIRTDVQHIGGEDIVNYYYNAEAAQRVAATIPGWHVPTSFDYDDLIAYLGDNASAKIRSTTGWNDGGGLDTYGFAALPCGRWVKPSAYPSNRGSEACFLTPDTDGALQYNYLLTSSEFKWVRNSPDQWFLSVRLIKDT
jgi:uncharacterized protein (TIGR02145 family)